MTNNNNWKIKRLTFWDQFISNKLSELKWIVMGLLMIIVLGFIGLLIVSSPKVTLITLTIIGFISGNVLIAKREVKEQEKMELDDKVIFGIGFFLVYSMGMCFAALLGIAIEHLLGTI